MGIRDESIILGCARLPSAENRSTPRYRQCAVSLLIKDSPRASGISQPAHHHCMPGVPGETKFLFSLLKTFLKRLIVPTGHRAQSGSGWASTSGCTRANSTAGILDAVGFFAKRAIFGWRRSAGTYLGPVASLAPLGPHPRGLVLLRRHPRRQRRRAASGPDFCHCM